MAQQQWDNGSSRGEYRQGEQRGQRNWRGSSRYENEYDREYGDDRGYRSNEFSNERQHRGSLQNDDTEFGGFGRSSTASEYYGSGRESERDFEDRTSRGRDYGNRSGSRYGGYARGGYSGSQYGRSEDESGYRGMQDWAQQSDRDRGRMGSSGYGYGQQGRQSFRGRGPKDYQRSDERLKEVICECLTDDERIDASDITVTVSSGEVTLQGTVPDRYTKHMAENRVAEIGGVQDVNNQLRTQGGADKGQSGRLGSSGSSYSSSGQSGYSSGQSSQSLEGSSETSAGKEKSSRKN